MNETIENLSSEQTLQSSGKLTGSASHKGKTVTLLDTVTVQAILCVMAAIAFVTVNIFDTGFAYDIFQIYWEKITVQENISDTFRMILDFLSSTPVS